MRPALAAALAAAFVLPAATAARATFPVEIAAETKGLPIEVRASAGRPLVVTLASKATKDATCRVSLATGLDTPVTRTVTVRAGRNATATFNLRSTPNRVRVIANCAPKA